MLQEEGGRFLIRLRRLFLVCPTNVALVNLFLWVILFLLAQAEVPMRHCVYLEPMIVLVLETNLLEAPLPFGDDQLSLVCALAGSVSRSMNVESEW